MNILILGGNGYLGSKIANSINHNIYCTIKTGEDLNLLNSKRCHMISDSISEIHKLITDVKFDIIINTVCCYERDGASLSSVVEANLIFPLKIIPFAIENGVNKIITIDTSLPENVNLYSLTKKTVSKIGLYYCEKIKNLIFYNVKLENFYGSDEPKNRFLHSVVSKLKNGSEVDLTEGKQRRDFIYIDDVLSAIQILIDNNDFGYHDVSLGTEEGPTIREIVHTLKTLLNSKSVLNFGAIESRKNEPDCVADLSYLRKFGFYIQYPYREGLKKII